MRLFLAAVGVVILVCPPGFGTAAEPLRPDPFEANEISRRDSADRFDFYQQGDRPPQSGFRDRPGNPPLYGVEPSDDTSPEPRAPAAPPRKGATTIGT